MTAAWSVLSQRAVVLLWRVSIPVWHWLHLWTRLTKAAARSVGHVHAKFYDYRGKWMKFYSVDEDVMRSVLYTLADKAFWECTIMNGAYWSMEATYVPPSCQKINKLIHNISAKFGNFRDNFWGISGQRPRSPASIRGRRKVWTLSDFFSDIYVMYADQFSKFFNRQTRQWVWNKALIMILSDVSS